VVNTLSLRHKHSALKEHLKIGLLLKKIQGLKQNLQIWKRWLTRV